ncbi:ABC transporter permease subunit [Metamycoplasma equirhinis]|uniref:ABC transporter permease subunit n=1 Tax=Metamycoplasma equirhinis TaxID=92402 RepID=A0ABZ0PAI9_9BACT|nr:ABC transporter permease subunit [Metamycoplasma equirhinis]TPD98176.1 ABC transporter permease subunit [Metamycoplasma equirhinis]WPB53665.1 ABC transporter permease subunit [Metamycoplasma equirhinis]
MPNNQKTLFKFAKQKTTIDSYVVHQSETKLFWRRFFLKKQNIASFIIFSLVILGSIFALFFIKNSPINSIDSNSIYVNNLPALNTTIFRNFERGSELDFIREIARLEKIRAFNQNESPIFQIFYDSAYDSGGDLTINTDIVVLAYNPFDLIKAINLNSTHKISLLPTILGTNQNGVDLYARLNVSLLITIVTILFAIAINLFIGFSLAAIYALNSNKWYANLIDKVASIINAIPEIIWIFILCVFLGTKWYGILIAFALISWISYYEIAKNEILALRNSEFILAAKVIGLNQFQIIYGHLFKKLLPSLIILITDRLAINVLIVSSLAFLNFITNENDLNIGIVLKEAISLSKSNPLYISLIVIYLIFFCVSLKLFNISLSTTLNPKVSI